VAARVEELLTLVGLNPQTYLRRFPHELSGGERQRVGVARALGADPPVLLMDEPFGAVDPIARKRLQEEFLDLQARLQKTVVLVTHDIEEALTLGHRIAIMERGAVIEQFDTPSAILARPATPFVAQFVGSDRGIRRLGVTEILESDIVRMGSIPLEATVAEVEAAARAGGSARLVILDGVGAPLGFVDAPVSGGASGVISTMRPFAAVIPLGASLKSAFVAMLEDDDPLVAVTGPDGYLGVLTLERLHAAVRRSAGSPSSAR
jgi:osmoprotectant transport system ATP-binding protein